MVEKLENPAFAELQSAEDQVEAVLFKQMLGIVEGVADNGGKAGGNRDKAKSLAWGRTAMST